MTNACEVSGCKMEVPPALREQQVCVLHFTLSVENSCAGMRRETALGNAPHERQREIMKFIAEHGERLARVATSGLPLTDELKARILSTFLTLVNVRQDPGRSHIGSSFGCPARSRSDPAGAIYAQLCFLASLFHCDLRCLRCSPMPCLYCDAARAHQRC